MDFQRPDADRLVERLNSWLVPLRSVGARSSILPAVLVTIAACGSSRPRPAATESTDAAHVERHWVSKPSLSVVSREGDPVAALAFAGENRSGPAANVALAAIVQRRVSARLGPPEVFPNAFGVSLVILLDDPKDAESLLQSLEYAFKVPIGLGDIDDRLLERLRAALGSGSAASAGDAALADCSGELYADSQQLELLHNRPRLRESVERARAEIFHSNSARFAVVGTENLTRAVELALSKMLAWPGAAPVGNLMASRPSTDVSLATGNSRHLSIAWRVNSIARANRAAEALRRRDSPLIAQVSALDADWKLESISSIARAVGACLRIDMSSASDGSTIIATNLETVARVAASESRMALEAANGPTLENQDFGLDNDPGRAARQIAWNSLSVPDQATQPSLRVHLRILPADASMTNLEPALRDAVTKRKPSPVDILAGLESGQSELWSIVASPCGTSQESADDAGSTAAWVQAICPRYTGHLGVQIEPWITVDGIGFIAHGLAQSASETPAAMATRLGNALGSIIATGTVTGAELAALREEVLLRVGATPRRGFWQLVDALSSSRPATFEPLGTFDSIRRLDLARLRDRRMAWLASPLRVGALLNRNKDQLDSLSSALHRWLDPHRSELHQCPLVLADSKPSREIQVTERNLDARDSSAYVAIQLTAQGRERVVYEHWLLWLLTRPGGWLETRLNQGPNSITADIMGPSYNRSLIVGLNLDDESKLADCIARLRDLMTQLSKQGAEARDVEMAKAWSDAQIRRAELDPRRRLVDLWRGNSAPSERQLTGFSRYLSQALASAAVTVVRVRRQP